MGWAARVKQAKRSAGEPTRGGNPTPYRPQVLSVNRKAIADAMAGGQRAVVHFPGTSYDVRPDGSFRRTTRVRPTPAPAVTFSETEPEESVIP